MWRGGRARVAMAAALAVLASASCTGGDDTRPRSLSDVTQTVSSTPAGPSSLSPGPTTALPTEALRGDTTLSLGLLLVPAVAEEVVYTDVAAVKSRLGYADLTGAAPTAKRFEFWERARADGAMLTGTRLYDYSSVMSLDYGWTGEDVDWEAAWSVDAETCIDPESCADGGYVLGLRRDLDWNVVVNSLSDNGFAEVEGSAGVYETDNPTAPFDQVRLIPELHALAVGGAAYPDAEDPAPVSAGEALLPLANRLDDVESAYIRPGCVPLETALGPDVVDDDLTAYFKANDPERLRSPGASALAIHDGSRATVLLQYDDPRSAAADADLREEVIEGWPGLQLGRPFSDVARVRVAADGGLGVVELMVHDMATLARMALIDDAPWALCRASPPPR